MTAAAFPLRMTAAWLREQYAAMKLTPRDVVEEIYRRALADRDMNVWIAPPEPEALEPYLQRLDAMDRSAPLWGIPFAIKDNIDLADVPTTAGCPAYAYTPGAHASVVCRLIEAGAIPLGKTNLDQFATGLVGTRSPYGETHNALKPELISGGSSSGSAVAVARGHAAFALGTDTAGSGRVPAALNGLVGLKPSLGSWPTRGVVPACRSLDCVTVFAHELEDAMLVDRIVRGPDASDPWSRTVDRLPLALPKRLLLPAGDWPFFGPYASEYEEAWRQAVKKAAQLGIEVETIDYALFAEAAAVLYDGPWVAERWAALGEFVEAHPGVAFPVTEQVLRSGSGARHDAASAFAAMHRIQALKHEAAKLLEGAALLLPTAGGTWSRDEVRRDPIRTNGDMGRWTNHCNLLDLCALAIPAGEAAPDVPFGVTLFALPGGEATLAMLAARWADPSEAPQLSSVMPAGPGTTTPVAVCGLHMRGLPLERQMIEHGAVFVREDKTASQYKLYKLPTSPAKPGLIKQAQGGASVELEIWEMPLDTFGRFAALIPAPLGIGKIELADGTEVPGFVCEGYASASAEDVTIAGSWRRA
ncbi:allophanate hydrolase [Cohnella sp. JJ-181]|uniref:allophanate hydrolase n=1 Tax=Cohnella rhizoplanae TaxID=2974897 RepID=UPI0022FF5FCD|nr:allophanate hydrolase [Cohnella sp. JJ-181]CAI6086141.1 Allophanate hydrolase [Cohnella sp. JJ-181]